ncbi:aldehyde dehydrogenase family protein [Amycolatopsis minnesotensis]|uniref:Aldehyde dehydrogenase family protein n=1 Tax=Amycolatopsis minnesotensis TaxID=337894 RepID=A0ABN2RQ93_9PSEU
MTGGEDLVRARLAEGPAGFLLGEKSGVPAEDGRTIEVDDPSTGTPIGSVAAAGQSDVDNAVSVAAAAVEDRRWSVKHPGKKALALARLGELIDEHADELAYWEALDGGIPIALGPLQAYAASGLCQYYSGWPSRLYGDLNPLVHNFHAYTLREPVGVVAVLVPWTQPLVTTLLRVLPALAAGNCVILKPSRRAPFSALRVAELAMEAGLPPGVLTVLTGDGPSTGAALAAHPGVDLVTYAGPTGPGVAVHGLAARTPGKRVLLQLGSTNAAVVFADADLGTAALAVASSVWQVAGQLPNACGRLLVHRSVHDEVVERVAEQLGTPKIGSALDQDTRMGPLISAAHRKHVLDAVALAEAGGAAAVLRGRIPDGPGYLLTPTLLTAETEAAVVATRELAGPVLTVLPFDDDEHAVRLANSGGGAIGAGLWTSDVVRVHRLAPRLRAGSVWVNVHGLMDGSAPYGGAGGSGLGRDGGQEWIHSYTDAKAVYVGLGPEPPR